MGVCASSHMTKQGGRMNWSTAKVIHLDGRLQEFTRPISAADVLSENSSCFICSAETMYVDSQAPPLSGDEKLQPGQIYFLMPISKSQTPLSLRDLCALAIKATTAVGPSSSSSSSIARRMTKTPSFSDGIRFPRSRQRCCRVPTGMTAQVIDGSRTLDRVL